MKVSKYLKYPTKAHGAIPAFQSYEEEAEWWDTHDTGAAEIEAEMTPVAVRSTRNYTENVQVRFDKESDRALETLAHERGLKKATLIRTWVLERLRQEYDQHRDAS
ncbi:MAG: hypothetical protein IVW57_10990 [Ktedonobacterales bacterium]|nr:hypothetical protein [Ktedonobacterales bacterium]